MSKFFLTMIVIFMCGILFQSFTRPHDIAILPNGDEAFVCEIGPNLVWKFMRGKTYFFFLMEFRIEDEYVYVEEKLSSAFSF